MITTTPRIKRFLLTAIFAALSLCGAEGFLRLLGIHDPILYELDSATGYRIKPNQTSTIWGRTIVINHWGVRDPRPLKAKPDGIRRILVLGDSVTWGGPAIVQDELFTTLAEKRMPGFEIVNAGVNGYSIARMAAHYEHLRGLNVDNVVIVAIPRDFTRPPFVALSERTPAFPLEKPDFAISYLARIARIRLYRRLEWGILKPPEDSVATEALSEEECFRKNLDALVEFKTSLGDIPLAVIMAPTLSSAPSMERMNQIRDAIMGLGIPYVSLNEIIAPDPAWFIDGVHLNSMGHAAVAPPLAEWIQDFLAER
ncbi:MAG: hypothetical protein AMXMBFR84_01870 [Candidatus Hydrogenedentota bacterium]